MNDLSTADIPASLPPARGQLISRAEQRRPVLGRCSLLGAVGRLRGCGSGRAQVRGNMSISSPRRDGFTCCHLPMKEHALIYAGRRLSRRRRPSYVEQHSYATPPSPRLLRVCLPRRRNPAFVLSLRQQHKPHARTARIQFVPVEWNASIWCRAGCCHRRWDRDDLFTLAYSLDCRGRWWSAVRNLFASILHYDLSITEVLPTTRQQIALSVSIIASSRTRDPCALMQLSWAPFHLDCIQVVHFSADITSDHAAPVSPSLITLFLLFIACSLC